MTPTDTTPLPHYLFACDGEAQHGDYLERFNRQTLARIAQLGPRCRARCHGTPCEFPEGHHGNHLTTKGGGFGWWTPEQSDPPDYWDKLLRTESEIGP